MLKTVLIPLTTVLCTIFLMMPATAEVVYIPDANLRTAINKTLNKPSDAPITVLEMLNLTELNVEDIGISTLTGLEHATKLTELSLVGKHLTTEEIGRRPPRYDGPLPNLHNPIFPLVDVTPLSNLTQLTKLELKDIRIVDVTPLSNLKKLTELNLINGSLLDVSLLSELTNLSKLDLSVNGISDVSSLTHLTNLKDLSLATNRISSVSSLSELTQLTMLDLSANYISNVSPLTRLMNLKELSLHSNDLSDVSPLAALTQLIQLDLGNNRIFGSKNRILDVSPLAALTQLKWLSLRSNVVLIDVSPLAALTQLGHLDLFGNTILDISSLTELTHLEVLELRNNTLAVGPIPVGLYPANPYGLHDMAGNVSEWCLDAYGSNFYSTVPSDGMARNPLAGAQSIQWILENYKNEWILENYKNVKPERVLRGGSWSSPAQNVRVAYRDSDSPTRMDGYIGFRCVRDVK